MVTAAFALLLGCGNSERQTYGEATDGGVVSSDATTGGDA